MPDGTVVNDLVEKSSSLPGVIDGLHLSLIVAIEVSCNEVCWMFTSQAKSSSATPAMVSRSFMEKVKGKPEATALYTKSTGRLASGALPIVSSYKLFQLNRQFSFYFACFNLAFSQ